MVVKPFSVSIWGGRGIGATHARVFSELGINISSILLSSLNKKKEVEVYYQKVLGQQPKIFDNLEKLLFYDSPHAVIIATPPHLHYDHLIHAAQINCPILCEKPLIWEKGITAKEYNKQLDTITNLNAPLCLNTSNAFFINEIRSLIPKKLTSFSFHFATKGILKGEEIIADLLPHNLALLSQISGHDSKVYVKEKNIKKKSCKLLFTYKGITCTSILSTQNSSSFMEFSIENQHYIRLQEGEGKTYKVFLETENKKISLEDPFRSMAKQFLFLCNQQHDCWSYVKKELYWNTQCLRDIFFA